LAVSAENFLYMTDTRWNAPAIRTLLADDHRVFLEGLRSVLARSPRYRFDVRSVAYSGTETIRQLNKGNIDLLILDLNLPGKDGLAVLRYLQQRMLDIRVLVLTYCEDKKVAQKALEYGADAYVLKSEPVEDLLCAVGMVVEGNSYLSPALAGEPEEELVAGRDFAMKHSLTRRELEILQLIGQGFSNKGIAGELYISDQTVGVHRKNIMRKLGVGNTASLLRLAFEHRLIK
jgi:DNA-binding NarL/FixJ family response regulator